MELKPCPFCGSKRIRKNGGFLYDFMECMGCDSKGPLGIALSRVPEGRWNDRADNEEILFLKEENKQLLLKIKNLETQLNKESWSI